MLSGKTVELSGLEDDSLLSVVERTGVEEGPELVDGVGSGDDSAVSMELPSKLVELSELLVVLLGWKGSRYCSCSEDSMERGFRNCQMACLWAARPTTTVPEKSKIPEK